MLAVTHIAIACASAQFLLGDSSWPVLGLAAIGSQLPDLDNSRSTIGRLPILGAIAHWIEARWPHRSVTHCLWASVGLAAACLPLYYWGSWQLWLAMPIGHLSAAIADTHTPQGVALFWPLPHRVFFTRNPRFQIATGSQAEIWLLAAATAIALVLANLNTNGSLLTYAANLLGTPESVERIYNIAGSTQQIWVDFEGVRASDRAPINGEFFLIAMEGDQLTLQSGTGIYRTGEQLIAERLRAEARGHAAIQTIKLAWADEELLPKLVQLYDAHPGAAIYLTGSLTTDAPDEIALDLDPSELPVIALSGTSLILDTCPIERLGAAIASEQWAQGEVDARIVFPKPEF